MSLPKGRKRSLDLEKDWVLTKEDFGAIGKPIFHEPKDLNSYLDFLDLLWGSERKEMSRRFYSEQFRL
jgi:hypothetical protein